MTFYSAKTATDTSIAHMNCRGISGLAGLFYLLIAVMSSCSDSPSKGRVIRIQYDIDQIMGEETNPFLMDLWDQLLGPDEEGYTNLFPQEKALQVLAEFSAMSGSGISLMVENNYYDLLNKTHGVARIVEIQPLIEALDEYKTVMRKYGFPENTEKCEMHYLGLGQNEKKSMDEMLIEIDRRHFGQKNKHDLWHYKTIEGPAREYVNKHIEVLRRRK